MEKFLKSSSAGRRVKKERVEKITRSKVQSAQHILYCTVVCTNVLFCTVRHRANNSPLKSELVYTIPTYEVVPGLKETTWSKED
jgi:hypothetical protein